MSNACNNTLASITDRKIPQETGTPNGIADYYLADIATVQDYYPFGMVMPGRNWQAATASGYGFGFNGKLKDDEIMGNSNSYDFGARIYDSRIGKWLSVDPKYKYFAAISPFSFAANSPIIIIDIDGKVIEFVNNDQTKAAKEVYQSIYDNADSDTKAALDRLNSSDIVFRISVTNNMNDIEKPGGNSVNDLAITYFNAEESNNTGNITVDIVIQLQPNYELTSAMGEELVQARQINEGEAGLIDLGTKNTGPAGGISGSDIYDEVNSKKGSISALLTTGYTLQGAERQINDILTIQGEAGLIEFLQNPKNGYAGYINLNKVKQNALNNSSFKQIKKDVKANNLKGFVYRKQKINGEFKTKIYKNKDYVPN